MDIEQELRKYLSSEEYDNERGSGGYLIAKHFYNMALAAVRKEAYTKVDEIKAVERQLARFKNELDAKKQVLADIIKFVDEQKQ